MVYLRSAIYFAFLTVSVIFYSSLVVILGYFLDFARLSRLANSWGRANLRVLKTVCGLDYLVQGLENLPDKNCIIMSKHQSSWETISLRAFLPPEQSWVLKQELLKVPFFGWSLKRFEPIAIDRKSGRQAVKQILRQGKAALEAGHWVVIFPEGTRTAPGHRKRYGIGGGVLAASSKASVVPIAHNAGVFWRRRALKKYPGVIDVVIGEPISTAGKKPEQVMQEVENWIEGKMAELPMGDMATASP